MLLVLTSAAYGIEQMMSFQGDALLNGNAINNGDLTVVIYSSQTGGTPVYNETFNNSINNGRFDVVLGNLSKDLLLDWGNNAFYYVDVYINGNKVTTQRQVFQNGINSVIYLNSTRRSMEMNSCSATGLNSVALGRHNTVSGHNSVVSGGFGNTVSGSDSVVSGGYRNTVSDQNSFVGGGYRNTVSGQNSFVGGGYYNNVSNDYSVVSGGFDNTVSGSDSVVSGGHGNTVSGFASVVSGGDHNTVSRHFSFVGGGQNNSVTGNWSVIPGGKDNFAGGNYSLVFGNGVQTSNDSVVMFFDNSNPGFLRINTEQMSDNTKVIKVGDDGVGANGNGAYLTDGGVWTDASSITVKEDFKEVDKSDILSKIMRLNIKNYKYKGKSEARYIGPFAEDFYYLFGLGEDPKHLAPQNTVGIALVAIQQLKKENDILAKKIESLEQRLSVLENKCR